MKEKQKPNLKNGHCMPDFPTKALLLIDCCVKVSVVKIGGSKTFDGSDRVSMAACDVNFLVVAK